MSIHDKDISKSINLNIIGTSNVVIVKTIQFKINLFFNWICLSRHKGQL